MQSTPRSPRGRPPVMALDERRRRILDAAADVFSERGYAAASMDEVAKACGMSRKTIYGLFSSKSDLFAALVMQAVPEPEEHEPFVGRSFEDALMRVIDRICAVALAPRGIASLRLVIAESRLAPELAAIYYENTVDRGRRFLAAELRRLNKAFGRADEDVEQLSDILFGAVVAGPLVHALVGDDKPDTREDALSKARRIVAALTYAPSRT